MPVGTSSPNENDMRSSRSRRDWRRWTLWGVPLLGGAVFFVLGIIFWGGFNTAMEATNTLSFCISCHEMRDTVFQEYKSTIHYQNRTGVRAICSDCHVPDPWVHKFVRKIQATRELYYKLTGSIDTKEKFEAKRLELAKRVWAAMKATDSRECRNCHDFHSMDPMHQRPRARKQHLNAFQTGQTCIDCHKGIAHKNVRDQLSEEELEALEKPDPAYVRAVPKMFLDGLKRAEAEEAERAAKAKAKAEAEEARIKARIEQAVIKAVAAAKAGASRARPSGKAGDAPSKTARAASTMGIDWSGIEAKTITLFYPGQASYEWVQTGKDHGGARAFLKIGDRCAECHAKEVADMGAKIVSGKKVEPTPIPGKRAAITMQVQAAHDGKTLFMRFRWPAAPHTPAPFVKGGKMDPENEVKLAMMIAGNGIDKVEQAGCWVTCHHDARTMPHHPDAAAIAAAGDVAGRLDVDAGITKYLAESRTRMEIKGRRGKKRGGWSKLKAQEELDALFKAGTFMDLLRWRSGEPAQNGHVLAERVMKGGVPLRASGGRDGDRWTVVLARPLKSDKPGDVSIEPGKTYTVGFAIHDDYTSARFHHVSLEFRLALDDPKAEINVVKR